MLRRAYRRLPISFRRQVRRARFTLQRRRDPGGADADAHALRGELARGSVRARRMGLDLHLDLEDGAARVAFFNGAIERPLLALLRSELRPGDVVADIGAHVGITAIAAAQRLRQLGGGGHVYAFEASPDTADRLRSHVEMNGVGALVSVIEVALMDVDGTVQLRADAFFGSADASTRSVFGTGEVVTDGIATRSFDAWARDEQLDRLDIVKLDVEGAEGAVIDGMRGSLLRHHPRVVVVEEKEYLFERAGRPPEAVRSRLAELDYRVEGSVQAYAPRDATEHDSCNIVYRWP